MYMYMTFIAGLDLVPSYMYFPLAIWMVVEPLARASVNSY